MCSGPIVGTVGDGGEREGRMHDFSPSHFNDGAFGGAATERERERERKKDERVPPGYSE